MRSIDGRNFRRHRRQRHCRCLARKTAASIFTALGLKPEEKDNDLIACTPPSWRHDLYREADLIEEVARCYGYDNIPVEPKIHIEVAPPNLREKTAGKVRSFLNGAGFYESINVSFVDAKTAEQFCEQTPEQHLSVADVSQKNLNLLRQNLIGSLTSRGNCPMNIHGSGW
jgi:phenylalanyl-tRNA synthetase beta chain